MQLRIILRTCSRSSVHFKERFIPVSKQELLLHCLRSLVVSLRRAHTGNRFRLSVIDDHSSPDCVEAIRGILEHCPFERELVSLEGEGNNASMKACYERALACPEPELYLVEDDYLHTPDCIGEMIEAYLYFREKMRSHDPVAEVAAMPVDNRFHYRDDSMFTSPLVLGPRRHWRVNFYSNWTLLLSRAGLQRGWPAFSKFAEYQLSDSETHEDATLVPLFRKAITLFTPVPTLAFHVAAPGYESPFSDWKRAWHDVAREWSSITNEAGRSQGAWRTVEPSL